MTRNEQIDFLNETVKCRLAPSPVHGIGVFAMRDIKKGDTLHCFPKHPAQWFNIPFGSMSKLLPEVKELILQRWPSIVNGSAFISPNDMMWMVTFINHADDPNYDVGTDTALRDIRKGEEIFEDYRLMDNHGMVYPWLIQNHEEPGIAHPGDQTASPERADESGGTAPASGEGDEREAGAVGRAAGGGEPAAGGNGKGQAVACRCFKCGAAYESDDLSDIAGDGYCPPCYEQKVAIAKAIDAKLGRLKPLPPKPPLPYTESISGGILVRTYRDAETQRILGR